jgi:hypothetical protein
MHVYDHNFIWFAAQDMSWFHSHSGSYQLLSIAPKTLKKYQTMTIYW